jgi:hypothetical protein
MGDVQIEEILAVLAEEYTGLGIDVLVLVDHDEVFDAGNGCPAVEVEHVGFDGLVPLGSLVLVLLDSGEDFLLLL